MTRRNDNSVKAKGGGVLALLCNVLGVLLIVAVIALAAPLTVPRLLGFEVYEVVSGSMEPAISTGSAVYAKQVEPTSVTEGDIIAFLDKGGVVVHRVAVNRSSTGEFVTKGDANPIEDFEPVPYDNLLGRVEFVVPFVGSFMTLYAGVVGKVYLLLAAACGVMLIVLGGCMRATRRSREQELIDEILGGSTRQVLADVPMAPETALASASKRRSRAGRLRTAAIVVLLVVFLGSGGIIGYTLWQYAMSDALYYDTSERFTSDNSRQSLQEKPPKTVDFASLRAENPDIVGWIYCEGTPIDYPVLQGTSNEQYLRTDYTGGYNVDGSIFVDYENRPGFVDSNTIIYGHHMNSGSMFACLEQWESQAFYNEHPVMWLLTPTKNYKIVLFSGRRLNSHSDWYLPVAETDPRFEAMLAEALEASDFKADLAAIVPGYSSSKSQENVKLDPKAHYVMLSTCATIFIDNDRYVLHGMLVEV